MPPKLKRRDKRHKCKRCGEKTTNRMYCSDCLRYLENNPKDTLYDEESYKLSIDFELEGYYEN